MSNESIYGVRLSNDFIAICIASCVRSIEGVIDFDDSIPQNLSVRQRQAGELNCIKKTMH